MTDEGSVGGGSERGARRPVVGVDAATLLGDDHAPFEDVLSGAVTGPLAVVGAPYAGRERVLDAAADRLDATRVRLDPGDDVARVRSELGDGPVVLDDCHHLYERRIGGFEPLETFLDSLAGTDTPVVTGWNRYAWAYLVAVRSLDRAFSARVDVGPVAAGDLSRLLLEADAGTSGFALDDPGRDGLISVRRHAVGWRGHTASVPVPVPDPGALASLRGGDGRTPSEAFFDRLATVSQGNVGVATAIWNATTPPDGARRPSDLVAPGTGLDVDRDEAFCLRIVLAKECIERAELVEAVGDRLDRILGQFVREGLLVVEGGLVCLEPAAVPAVAAATERRRIA